MTEVQYENAVNAKRPIQFSTGAGFPGRAVYVAAFAEYLAAEE